MKLTKKNLLSVEPFFEGFEDAKDVLYEFCAAGELRWNPTEENRLEHEKAVDKLSKQYHIIYANYYVGNYEGEAYVFGYDKKEGKFFEVYGCHCSCYGLEGMWDVEYSTMDEVKELLRRKATVEVHSWNSDSTEVSFKTWINKNFNKE